MTQLSIMLLGNPGAQYWVNGRFYIADSNGVITGGVQNGVAFSGINSDDVSELTGDAGCALCALRTRWTNFGAVRAASATAIVSSAALSNGTLSIAAQTDVPRQLQFVINPGAAAITAGGLELDYDDQNFQPVTDTLSLITGANTATTVTSSTGCMNLRAAKVANLAGGSSPNIQGGYNTVLAIPHDYPATGFKVVKATQAGVVDTLPTTTVAAKPWLITPNTAPDGTKALSFGSLHYST